MSDGQGVSRRDFLNATAVAGMGVLAMGDSPSLGQEPGKARSGSKQSRKLTALPQIRLMADLFVQWQMDIGRLDPRRAPALTNSGAKRNSYWRWATGLNQAYRAIGIEAYRVAADRLAVFYLSCLCNTANFHPPHFGLGLAMYGELKQNYPSVTDFDDKAAALFKWMKPFQWKEASYYRNGYPGGAMPDAGNSSDNADAGLGLVCYCSVKKNPEVLAAAETMAKYFLTELKPGTYQGVWSSKRGTWVVAPTTQDRFEQFENVKSCEMAWGYSSIQSIDYLIRLAKLTDDKNLQKSIAEKCATSMKWQFDTCQFDDGACGLSGQDDKWLGMTAAAILSYLWVRDTGYLSKEDVTAYRTKAIAARDWLLANISKKNLLSESPGYFRIHGKSLPKPADNVAWLLGYALQALLRIQDI